MTFLRSTTNDETEMIFFIFFIVIPYIHSDLAIDIESVFDGFAVKKQAFDVQSVLSFLNTC